MAPDRGLSPYPGDNPGRLSSLKKMEANVLSISGPALKSGGAPLLGGVPPDDD